ncbi:MAG: GntP family permease [Planctomycetaceae bacterium]
MPPILFADSDLQFWPFVTLAVGIASVLGMIIVLRMNAFLAMVIAAIVVSLMVEGSAGARLDAVATEFGKSAGGIGIVIAMAAIIGKCMLDSGAADRIVRWAVGITGEGKASLGLMLSGFVLAIPVFFDTVFYLLVPLARSLHKRTGKHYLRYLMAIATGGAITHTLVPPTPGPLLVSANLGVDVGMMMLVGTLVALPSAVVGLLFAVWIDAKLPVPMRTLGPRDESQTPVPESQLPSLFVSMLPVVLPVLLIGGGTLAMTIADREDRAQVTVGDIVDYPALSDAFASAEAGTPAARVLDSPQLTTADRQALITPATTQEQKAAVADALNRLINDPRLYDKTVFLGVRLSSTASDLLASNQLRIKPVDRRRMNRAILEDLFPEAIAKHQWDTPARDFANAWGLWSNPNFALLLAALIAMATLKRVRKLSLLQLANDVEESLMSGGVIILITAAGGAFGAMLQAADIGPAIESVFAGKRGGGVSLLVLGFVISAVLKIAQGSSTVAMIIASAMMAAMVSSAPPDYHLVYIATAVGSGSLFGSWMNDSGFWVYAKMGGLTEREALTSWTPGLVVLSICGLLFTILFSQVLPLV